MVWKHVSDIAVKADGGCAFSTFANGLHMIKVTVLFNVFTDDVAPTAGEVLANTASV